MRESSSAALELRASDADIELLEDSGVFALEEVHDDDDDDDSDVVTVDLDLDLDALAHATTTPREIVVPTGDLLAFPTPGSIVRDITRPMVIAPVAPLASSPLPSSPLPVRAKPTFVIDKPRATTKRPARWPLAMCAFVAIACASASFVMSPVGTRSAVTQDLVQSAREGMSAVVATVRSFR